MHINKPLIAKLLLVVLPLWMVGAVAQRGESSPWAWAAPPTVADPKPDREAPPAGTTKEASPEVKALRRQALKLRRFVKADWVRRFVKATKYLPDIEPRTLYIDRANNTAYSEIEAEALSQQERDKLTKQTRDGNFYYNTKHGTPLAYARALDVLAAEGFEVRPGTKIVDYGFGSIGQLRLLACLGAEVTGIEVDDELRALYSYPGDQGRIEGARGVAGALRLVHGFFPSDEKVKRSVGTGYDLFIAKNVLKNGCLHPARPVDQSKLLDLGVEEQEFVQTLFDMLNPGGYVLIYNLCPPEAAPDEPYIPWADGRSPFSTDMYESVGFEVLVFDRVDTEAARKMARKLGWEEGPYAEVLKQGLFAWYTIVKKPETE
jgi:hypothetical protein